MSSSDDDSWPTTETPFTASLLMSDISFKRCLDYYFVTSLLFYIGFFGTPSSATPSSCVVLFAHFTRTPLLELTSGVVLGRLTRSAGLLFAPQRMDGQSAKDDSES